jgi:hypothetical protein
VIIAAPINTDATCSDPRAFILEPRDGSIVHTPLIVRGTASGKQFRSYRVEIAYSYLLHHTTSSYAWIPLQRAGITPVINDILVSESITDRLPVLQGDLTLRLTVMNTDGSFLTPCEVSFHLTDAIATEPAADS